MRDVNVAVWGLGPHAIKNILPALQASPGLRLHGVCSRNAEVVSSVRDRFGCEGWRSTDRLLADPDVDVVYLSTPIGLHAAQGEAVLSAGKHLWCEKPLAERSDQALSLTELSRERILTLAEGFMYLFHPQFVALRETVRSGRLGRVLSISLRFGIPPLERPGFRTDPELGGGAFLDVGTYLISALASLLPDLDPSVRFAEIVTAAGSPVDSEGRAILRYQEGASALLEWRTGSAYRNEVDVWGTDGSVSSERLFSKAADYVPQFRFRDVHGREHCEGGEAANQFVLMFAAFRQLIEDPVAAENERQLITRRARLTDEVWDHSRRGST